MNRVLFLAILTFLAFQPLASQYNDLKFRHITTLNGLSQGTVKSFVQDEKGFIWAGTRNGLNRFDGYTFTVFKNIPGDSASLSNNHITSMALSKNGKLWIATWGNGINEFDLKTLHFSRHVNHRFNLGNLFVNCILEDSEGNLWIGTDGEGLYRYNSTSDQVTHFFNNAEPGNLSDNVIRSLYEDSNKQLWIGTQSGGLNLFDRAANKFFNQSNPHHSFHFPAALNIRSICELNGKLGLGTYGDGLILMDRKKGTMQKYTHSCCKKGSLAHNNILALLPDKNGILWIGTENGGLSIFDQEKNTFYRYRNDPMDNTSLNSNSIYTLFEDNAGNVWAGTWNGGINLVQKDAQQFRHYSRNSHPGSLSNNHVLCITEDSEGYLWVGTDGGGLNMLDPATGKFTHFRHNENDPRTIGGDFVLSVCEAHNKEIWIGTYGGGISIYNKNTKKFRHLRTAAGKTGGISSDYVWYIYKDSKNRMWIGLCPGGVNVFDPATGKMIHYQHQTTENSLSHNNIHSIFEDSSGHIWIGTNGGGLNKLNPATGKFTRFGIKQGLSHNSLGHIYEDKNRNLWIGTDAGLDYLDTKTGKITNYGPNAGLPSCFIYGILEDSNNNLWISSNEGLIRFNPIRKEVNIYSVNDGLQSNELNLNAFCKAKSGAMYFGGSNGFNKFHPDKINESPSNSTPVFTDFSIFNKSVEISGSDSPLKNHIAYTNEITLPYNASVFSFEFAVLNFRVPGNNQYAYKMEGFDKEWNVRTNRTVTYTNLDPGTYTFKVKAISAGNAEPGELSIKINIKPPFRRTIWFKILLLFVLGTGFILVLQLRTKTIRKQNIRLEEKVKNRTSKIMEMNSLLQEQTQHLNSTNHLLQEKNEKVEELAKELTEQKENLIRMNRDLNDLNATKDKFLSIIAHDIKNPFNTILGFTALLKLNFSRWTDEKKLHSISLINRSAQHLYNLLENLLQWSRAQRGIIDFNPSTIQVDELLDHISHFLKNNLNEKSISLNIDPSCNGLVIFADRNMIETVLRNIVGNAIKFTPNDGKITISACSDESSDQITVTDNGIGMTEIQVSRLFRIDSSVSTPGTNKETGTGLGLLLSHEFINRHGGKITVTSHEGEGSVFTIILPKQPTF